MLDKNVLIEEPILELGMASSNLQLNTTPNHRTTKYNGCIMAACFSRVVLVVMLTRNANKNVLIAESILELGMGSSNLQLNTTPNHHKNTSQNITAVCFSRGGLVFILTKNA